MRTCTWLANANPVLNKANVRLGSRGGSRHSCLLRWVCLFVVRWYALVVTLDRSLCGKVDGRNEWQAAVRCLLTKQTSLFTIFCVSSKVVEDFPCSELFDVLRIEKRWGKPLIPWFTSLHPVRAEKCGGRRQQLVKMCQSNRLSESIRLNLLLKISSQSSPLEMLPWGAEYAIFRCGSILRDLGNSSIEKLFLLMGECSGLRMWWACGVLCLPGGQFGIIPCKCKLELHELLSPSSTLSNL